jgi:XRE family aerobic/anaerobic benzoate catabolism transcriptional regulator
MLLTALAARIRDLRARRGWTAKETARRAGLSLRFYHGLESGTVNVSVTRLASLAEALGVSMSDLFRPDEKKSVALLGLRGAGKSTIGPKLAKALGCRFVELDELIEREANLSLAEIFNIHGEPYYRKLESDCVQLILSRGAPGVIAMPGGIVRNDDAFSAIRQKCTTVWLKARPTDHMKRVYAQGDRRPMANRANAMEELKNILRDREPLYQQAEIHVDTSARSIADSVRGLASSLRARGWSS